MSLLQNPFKLPGINDATYERHLRAVDEHAARGINISSLSREQWETSNDELKRAFGLNSSNFLERLVFAPVSVFGITNKLGMEWIPVLGLVSGLAWYGIIRAAGKVYRSC